MIDALYVHIPFCAQKCLYCDFNSYSNQELQNAYMEALEKELKSINQSKFKTIFIGGGTPTFLSSKNLEELLKLLKNFEALEYTVECNPGTLTKEKLSLMKGYKVNRLSIGLQAWQNNLLKDLGRIHTINDFLENYINARNLGFNNINLDLMFGIPNQRTKDWEETISEIIKLKPEHISSYGLIIEEGTPFYDMNSNGLLNLVDEDDERAMYYYAREELTKKGYEQYEISNFAIPGYECKHNITYWKAEEYYGIGAGAHSYVNKIRYSNYLGIEEYIHNLNSGDVVQFKNPLTKEDELSEFMFLGLRLNQGISKFDFNKRFNTDIYNIYGNELNTLIKAALLVDNGEFIKLTDRGMDISNQVFINFLK